MKQLPNIKQVFPEVFSFLLLMGGCARKASFGMSDLGSHNRPFLVGEII